jgi:hypothetical protein
MILFFLFSCVHAEWHNTYSDEPYGILERMTHLFFNKNQLTSQTLPFVPIPQMNCVGSVAECAAFNILRFECTKASKDSWTQWKCNPQYGANPLESWNIRMRIQPWTKNITCSTSSHESCALFYGFELSEVEKLRLEEQEYNELCLTRTESAFLVGFLLAFVGLPVFLLLLTVALADVKIDYKQRSVLFSARASPCRDLPNTETTVSETESKEK